MMSHSTLYIPSPSSARLTRCSLLQPLLNLFHTLPSTVLAPPLSTVLHTLLSFPFSPHLLPTWHSVPEPPSPASSTSSMRSLINKISNLGSSASPDKRKRKSIQTRADSSSSPSGQSGQPAQQQGESAGLGLYSHTSAHSRQASARSKSPSQPTIEATGKAGTRQHRVIPTITDASAFPLRALRILNSWFEAYIPYPLKADEIDSKVMVEEVLPPVLLLVARAAEGSKEFRKVFRDELLPSDL